MNLTLIAAMSENRVIGKDNDLVWHLPDDMKRFKELTLGHHVIMGRRTYESMNAPLPKRTNIVVTSSENFDAPGCIIVHSLEEAVQKAENDNQPFIIGGGEVYRQALRFTDTMELTVVHTEVEGDTFFPEFDQSRWELINKTEHPADDKHKYSFDFLTYKAL